MIGAILSLNVHYVKVLEQKKLSRTFSLNLSTHIPGEDVFP